jgi:hypothetical protein
MVVISAPHLDQDVFVTGCEADDNAPNWDDFETHTTSSSSGDEYNSLRQK